jgi:hypothetical protein
MSDGRHKINKRPFLEIWIDREFTFGDTSDKAGSVWDV